MLLWASLTVLYIIMFVWLGLTTFRRGHTVLGILGFLFPLLWIIGAFTAGPNDEAA
jgi:hypothetical protein